MTNIFLSYNREDQARAKLFAEAFEAQGFKVGAGDAMPEESGA